MVAKLIKFFKEAMLYVDYLIVTNERHKQVAVQYFKFPAHKVKVIPNTLLSSYYDKYRDDQFISLGLENYVFTIGNVCNRKNQIRLALACNELNINLLIVGPVLDGEENYGKELSKIVKVSRNIIWLESLKRDSMELISAYKKSLCFALPSLNDQQPTCAQEAGLLGKPLLLGDMPYAYQKFYTNARLVNPHSVRSISKGLEEVIKNPSKFVPPIEVFEDCKGENVAKSYIQIYNEVFNG